MITTNNDEIYNTSLSLREHGKKDPKFNYHTELGYNWRFSEIHALLGILAMNKCNSIINERKHLAKLYDKALEDVSGVSNIAVPDNIVTPYYKYILYLDEKFERERIKLKLKEDYNIFLPGEVYAEPCHSQPVFNKYPELILNDASDEFPGAHYVSERQICLPLYPKLKEDEVMYVTKSLKEVLSHFA